MKPARTAIFGRNADLRTRYLVGAQIGLMATLIELILATGGSLLQFHVYTYIDRQRLSALDRDSLYLLSQWLLGLEPFVHAVSFTLLAWIFIPSSAAMAWIGLSAAFAVDLLCLFNSGVTLSSVPEAAASTANGSASNDSSMLMLSLDLCSRLLAFVGYLFMGLAVLSGPFRSRVLAVFFFFGTIYSLFWLLTFDSKASIFSFINDEVIPVVLILERVAIILWFRRTIQQVRGLVPVASARTMSASARIAG